MVFTVKHKTEEVISVLNKFFETEVASLQEKYKRELENERYFYNEDGTYSSNVQDAFKQIRMKSAESGFL